MRLTTACRMKVASGILDVSIEQAGNVIMPSLLGIPNLPLRLTSVTPISVTLPTSW